jgi:glycosyltransferase involved in cell wall biosynthesis
MQIIHVVPGRSDNGRNFVVNNLATQQTRAGHQVRLWTITKYTRHDCPPKLFQTHLFRAHNNPFTLDRRLLQDLDSISPDTIFHLHGAFTPVLYSLGMKLHSRNIPFVLSGHGEYNTIAMMQHHSWRRKLYFYFYERKLLDAAQAIHCLGKSEVSGIQRIHPNKKTVTIPYGFESPAPCSINPLPDVFILGYCGRLEVRNKGLDLLLPAFASFQRMVPQARLWIVGEGRGRANLEALASRLDIADKIIFFGARFGDERLALLSKMQLFVCPSRNEGLPSSVLEAASIGLPCVVTEATNLGDAIKEYACGEVIPVPHPFSLLQAIVRLHERILQNGRPTLGNNAKRMVREGFDWRKIIESFHKQLYCCSI